MHDTLAAALAAFQSQLPVVAKGNRATVRPKDGGATFSYDYADLADVSAIVLPALAKHGLSFSAAPGLVDPFGFVLNYELRHAGSEETVGGFYPLPSNGTPQAIGSAITYARRYALCAVTGIAPGGDDDDAQQAEQAHRPARDWLAEAGAAENADALVALWREARASRAPAPILSRLEELGSALRQEETGGAMLQRRGGDDDD